MKALRHLFLNNFLAGGAVHHKGPHNLYDNCNCSDMVTTEQQLPQNTAKYLQYFPFLTFSSTALLTAYTYSSFSGI
jgi:hypothetical protein